jgi:hypothetical protein
MLVGRSITSRTSISIAETELEENIQRKGLTPAKLSKETVHKAEQVVPSLPSATEGKKARGEKRTCAAPKVEVAEAIGVGTTTLVRAEQHVSAMERYPILGQPASRDPLHWCAWKPTVSRGANPWRGVASYPPG